MIDLYEAFKLTKIQMDDVVFLKTCDAVKGQHQILTKREIVQKLDMRHTFVTEISPYFICGDYQGLLFTILKKNKNKGEYR